MNFFTFDFYGTRHQPFSLCITGSHQNPQFLPKQLTPLFLPTLPSFHYKNNVLIGVFLSFSVFLFVFYFSFFFSFFFFPCWFTGQILSLGEQEEH